MQYLDLSDYSDRIIACGDIHGEFETLVYEIGRHQITDSIVIVAGDCGFGFSRPTYYDDLYTKKMHKKLEKANVLLLMVRGNHDDPVFFEKELIDYPYMKALPDYTIVHTQSHNVLCVGGAVSVDRNFRLSLMSLPRKNKMPHNHHLHSWYYGHFHDSGTIDYEGVLFHLLNINELKEIPNTSR